MIIETQQSEGITLRLSEGDIGHWNNALNEVCNGFSVANFQAAIGIARESAGALLERTHSLTPEGPEYFGLDEVLAVRNALTAVLAELDPAEFHARMGYTVEESKQMRNTLDELARHMRLVKTA
ncbi:MAG TPA: hypothetical protein VMB49_15520 [Acidobacteriaceae bacterium]|nr:hypothetical protein [Acidobacteriaceae bacterium]